MAVSKTRSRCAVETVRGTHVFEISDYSLQTGRGVGTFIRSATFDVGGYGWSIRFYPDGSSEEWKDHASAYLELMTKNTTARISKSIRLVNLADPAPFQSTLQSKPVVYDSNSDIVAAFARGQHTFVKTSELEANLRDDRIAIQCDLTVIKDPVVSEAEPFAEVEVPPSDMAGHVGSLLEEKESADVTFVVEGEPFPAHRLVLAMRSPVFKAELYGPMMEKDMTTIPIADMQPAVFRALLRFIYTDSLPAFDGGDDGREMVEHLIVAADRYAMERLKLMCESILSKGLHDLETAVATVALADRHQCSRLKDACVEFINDSCGFDDVLASEGYAQLKTSSPSAAVELWEKSNKRLRKA